MSDQPIPGRCGARKHDGSGYCGHEPLPGKMRCKFHGGMSGGPRTAEGKAIVAGNAIKHGLWAQKRRDNFAKMGIPQEIFDSIPTNVDLTEEIATARANLQRFEAMLADNQKFIYSDPKGKTGTSEITRNEETGELQENMLLAGTRVALSVEDLYQKQKDLLRRLLKTQAEIRPGGDIGGNLHFTITVTTGAKQAADDAVPVLTEEESEMPPEDLEADPVALAEAKTDLGYDD